MARSLDLASAWIKTAPFSLDAAYADGGLRSIVLDEHGLFAPAAVALWKGVEQTMVPRWSGVSIATLEQLRDHSWFAASSATHARSTRLSLRDYLCSLADHYIENGGICPALRSFDHPGIAGYDLVRRWRWLSLLMPVDLLVAAYSADHHSAPLDRSPRLASQQLSKILEWDGRSQHFGVAETHVHGSAAIGFADVWLNWLRALAESPRLSTPSDHAAPPFGDAPRLHSMSVCAAIARAWMWCYLDRHAGGVSARPAEFDDAWVRAVAQRLSERSSRDALWVEVLGTSLPTTRLVRVAIRSVERCLPPEDTSLREPLWRLWRAMVASAAERDQRERDDARGARFEPTMCGVSELAFTRAALVFLGRHGDPDSRFARVFWQYVRVRVALFRYLTLEPGTPGLDWFSRTDRRAALFRDRAFFRDRVELGVRHDGAELGLRAYEPRFIPQDTAQRSLVVLRNDIASAIRAKRRDEKRGAWEFGVVLHFTKADRSEHASGSGQRRLLASPSGRVPLAYSEWIAQQSMRATAASEMLRYFPEALLVVRGVDVAGRELSMPLWPTTSMLRMVRRASTRAATIARGKWPSLGLRPLGTTYHVGEDYRYLTEGIRRVHEVIEARLVGRGDRLGHAVALGDLPSRVAREQGVAFIPCIERWNDLLWELDRYAERSWAPPPGRAEFVRERCDALFERLFRQPPVDLRAQRRLRKLLWNPSVQNSLGYFWVDPTLRDEHDLSPQPEDWPLLREMTEDRRFFLRANESVQVCVDQDEIDVQTRAQAWLRAIVTEREITVETNPSSNLLIGDFADIREHPVFRLLPLQRERTQTPVLVSLNSDDPVVFATRLADEYAYAFHAMLRAGVSTPDAIEWLDQVRSNGVRSRFTLPASANIDCLRWLEIRLSCGANAETERIERGWSRAAPGELS